MQLTLYGETIWLFCEAVDFRKSIDGLVWLVEKESSHGVQEGIYVFYNKGRDKVKCLSWHKNGFMLLYKRLEGSRFCFEPSPSGTVKMGVDELGWLLAGLPWQKMGSWRELNYTRFA